MKTWRRWQSETCTKITTCFEFPFLAARQFLFFVPKRIYAEHDLLLHNDAVTPSFTSQQLSICAARTYASIIFYLCLVFEKNKRFAWAWSPNCFKRQVIL